MTIAAPPVTAEMVVQRLLAIDDADQRRALIAGHDLAPDEARRAIQLLLDEAERLIGVDPRRMEWVCLDALALAERGGDEFLWAMARFKQGESCTLQDRNAEARGYLDEAAAIFARLGRPVEAARTRIHWVWATANLGGDAEALATARVTRRVFAAHGETLRLATLDLHIGIIHATRARYPAALRYFRSALALYQSLGEIVRAARVHHNIALALARLGRYRPVLVELERARAAYQESGHAAQRAMATRSLGEAHMNLGRYAAALRAFEEAQPIFRARGLHAGAVWLARDTADCYLRLNRPADALHILNQAGADLRHVDRATDVYAIAIRRAAAHLMLDQRGEALAVLDAVRRDYPAGDTHDQAWLAAQRAAVLLRDGLPDEALAASRQAVTLAGATGMRRLTADARLIEGAALLALGRIDEAQRVGAHARRLARAQDAAPLLHRAYELLGRAAEARGRMRTAVRCYGEAIRQLEREQRGVIFEFRDSFAAGRGVAYERLAAVQLRSGRTAEALATAERAKSRALADAIAGNVELRPRGSAATRRLARELAAAREDYAAAFAYLSRDEPGGAGGSLDGGAPHLAALETRISGLVRQLQLAGAGDDMADLYGAAPGAVLPPVAADTTLVEFFFSGDDVLRFAVDATGVRGRMLTGVAPEVERLLRAFRLNLDATERAVSEGRDRLAGQARTVLTRLYSLLLADMDLAEGCRSLVIVPHGLLHYLPFHTLHDGERYLIERLNVSYAPSAALYGICHARARRRSGRGGALVLGHSADGRLPYTLDEAARVADVLGVQAHLETAATRTLLETEGQRAGIVHIAAHGQFRTDAPLFSHVQLAGGPLTTADVFNLDLQAALVTLSACETGRAVLGGGDELIGLSRAFLYAGAAGLLVSQWRVDDAATAALMTRFYEEFSRGPLRGDAAGALRAAQMGSIEPDGTFGSGRRHPFFWAGFQVIGAGPSGSN